MVKVKLGKKVPDFTATATNDSEFSLSKNIGKNIVIYFYPKDNTPGCTKEGEDFRDQFKAFGSNNAIIVGVNHKGEAFIVEGSRSRLSALSKCKKWKCSCSRYGKRKCKKWY